MGGWSSTKPNSNQDKKRLSDLVGLMEWPSKPKYVKVRAIGPVTGFAQHWLTIKTNAKKEVNIPKLCLNYDAKTDSFVDNGCPYCKTEFPARKHYIGNFIVRKEVENEPRKKKPHEKSETKLKKVTECDKGEFYIKNLNSNSWTPVKVLQLPPMVTEELKSLTDLNRHETKDGEKAFDINHPKYGIDISIKYDADAKGAKKYSIQKEGKTPLKEDEKEYLLYSLDVMIPETLEQAKIQFKNMKNRLVTEEKDSDDEDVEDDEEGFDEVDEDDEDDMDDKKSKKSKKKSKKKDEEEDEDDLEDDSDSDDEDNSDSDDDEEDDSDDEEDEKPSKKSKSKKSKKKKSKNDDEEDEDEDNSDDEDLDEDDDSDDEDKDERSKKKNKKSDKKSKKKKSKNDDEDDDLDDLDEDLD